MFERMGKSTWFAAASLVLGGAAQAQDIKVESPDMSAAPAACAPEKNPASSTESPHFQDGTAPLEWRGRTKEMDDLVLGTLPKDLGRVSTFEKKEEQPSCDHPPTS